VKNQAWQIMSTKIKECFDAFLVAFSTFFGSAKTQPNTIKRAKMGHFYRSVTYPIKNVDFILTIGLKLGKKS